MLNEERIILMTKLASYESGEGKKCAATGSYFRSDYVGMQVVKSVICGTLAFLICFALYVLYDFETFMLEIYKMDLFVLQTGSDPLRRHGGGVRAADLCGILLPLQQGKEKSENYYNNLKRLASLYEKISQNFSE